ALLSRQQGIGRGVGGYAVIGKEVRWLDHKIPLVEKALKPRNERVVTDKRYPLRLVSIHDDVDNLRLGILLRGPILEYATGVRGSCCKIVKSLLLAPREVAAHLMTKGLTQ